MTKPILHHLWQSSHSSALPSTSVHYDGQIARVGLNYHFDGLSAPLFGRD